jgi:hypothetical protein
VPIAIDVITVWINAFLPRDIAGLTTTLRDGPCAGKTAVEGPAFYVTDQRGFSTERRAAARMHSCVTIDFRASAPVVGQAHRCDPTVMCGRPPEAAPRVARASTARMRGVVASIEPLVEVRLDALVGHPFAALTPVGADIAYHGDIVVDRAARAVRVDLMVQLFPAFEGYASINDGPPGVLFRQAPVPGAGQLRLPPGAHRRTRSSLQDADGDGVFEGPVARTHGEDVSSIHRGEG